MGFFKYSKTKAKIFLIVLPFAALSTYFLGGAAGWWGYPFDYPVYSIFTLFNLPLGLGLYASIYLFSLLNLSLLQYESFTFFSIYLGFAFELFYIYFIACVINKIKEKMKNAKSKEKNFYNICCVFIYNDILPQPKGWGILRFLKLVRDVLPGS